MGDDTAKTASRSEAELEREIRSGRDFSLAEAIGRLGGNLLKGASPVTRKRQAELLVDLFLEQHLADAEGALRVVLERRLAESELASGYEQPLLALARTLEHLLGSQERLESFVHQVDAEWGRMYLERPCFQRAGQKPQPDDPYTFSSVRATLTSLLDDLRSHLDPAPAGG